MVHSIKGNNDGERGTKEREAPGTRGSAKAFYYPFIEGELGFVWVYGQRAGCPVERVSCPKNKINGSLTCRAYLRSELAVERKRLIHASGLIIVLFYYYHDYFFNKRKICILL